MLHALRTPLAAVFLAAAAVGLTSGTAQAQDDDLDDFELDLGDAPDSKPSPPPAEEDAEPDAFDFSDDPDWDAGPAPLPNDIGGLDADPIEDIPAGGGLQDNAFLSEDPPDDLVMPAAVPVGLDADPPETGRRSPAALGIGLDTKGKTPLADNYPAKVVAKDLDAVVVELPVLVASKPADHTDDYWVVAEVRVGDRRVSETRQLVTRAGVADMGPTVVWLKSHVPVLERAGEVELVVSRAPDAGAQTEPLFTKTVKYAL